MMISAALSIILQIALYGVEVNLGEMGQGHLWVRTGDSCWYIDVSRYAEGPKLAAWTSAYDAMHLTQQYHVAKGNVTPPDATRIAFCAAKTGVDTSLMIAPPVPAPVTSITAPTGKLVSAEGTWTFSPQLAAGGNVILLNGSPAGGGSAKTLKLVNGKVYALNIAGSWYVWNNGWSGTTAP